MKNIFLTALLLSLSLFANGEKFLKISPFKLELMEL
jgi:hypothetical protein